MLISLFCPDYPSKSFLFYVKDPTVKNDFDVVCPLVDINFSQDYDIECIEGQFLDWQSCGKYCGTIYDCQYWSFEIYNNRCCIKASFLIQYHEYDVISGVRGCP